MVANPFNPTYFGTINFVHHYTAVNADGVTTADSNLKYSLDTQSGYVRDTIDLARWLQVMAGVRFDRFDCRRLDMNTNTLRARVDEKLSKQAAVIFKPSGQPVDLHRLQHVVPAGLRRSVQRSINRAP